MVEPIDTSKLGPVRIEPTRTVAMAFTDEEWLDIRTALLTASAMADSARAAMACVGPDAEKLDKARWSYLTLAERIAAQ